MTKFKNIILWPYYPLQLFPTKLYKRAIIIFNFVFINDLNKYLEDDSLWELNSVFMIKFGGKISTHKWDTQAKTEIVYPKNVRAKVAMDFTYWWIFGTQDKKSYVISIGTFALTFYGYIISILASVEKISNESFNSTFYTLK